MMIRRLAESDAQTEGADVNAGTSSMKFVEAGLSSRIEKERDSVGEPAGPTVMFRPEVLGTVVFLPDGAGNRAFDGETTPVVAP